MASPPRPGPIKLTPEAVKRLQTAQEDIEGAKRNLEVIKKLGFDTKELEEKLKWAEEVAKTLLSEFR